MLTILNVEEDMEKQELSFVVGGNAKGHSHFVRPSMVSNKNKHILTIQSSNHALWYLHKTLHTNVSRSFIHNYQNSESTKMVFSC